MTGVRQYLDFLRAHGALLGFGFLAVFWGNFGQSFFVAWFGAEIQRDLGLSAGVYGSAYSLATLFSAFTVVWAGGLVDRLPLRTYAVAVAMGLAAAALVLSQAIGLLSLFLGFFLLRLFGQALLPHTGVTTMARWFAQSRGKAISIAMSGVPAGEIVLPIMAVALVALIGWQGTFLVVAISSVVVLIPLLLLLLHHALPGGGQIDPSITDEPLVDDNGAEASRRWPGRREVLRDYRFWLALPALMAAPFLITGIFIHQNFIVEQKGWTMSWLATCFAVYGLVHWLSALIVGALVDRVGPYRLLPWVMVPLLASVLVVAYLPGWYTALLMMLFLGIAAGSGPPIAGALWPEVYGTRNLGAIRSMNIAIMVTATSISPVLFGLLIDRGMSVQGLFGGSAVYVLLALLLVCFSYPANSTSLVAAQSTGNNRQVSTND